MRSPCASPRLLLAACGLLALCAALPATAQRKPVRPAPPRTVRDYFLLLPQSYFEIGRDQRAIRLASRGGIVDLRHDFLHFPPQDAQGALDVALFRHKSDVLVAVYVKEVDGILDFLRYRHGHWVTVTKSVMPVAYSGDNEYALPRRGTTIRVTANKFSEETQQRAAPVGRWVYDLVWRGGRFVVRR